MGILALLAQASACAYPDGKRPLPAGRLNLLPITRFTCHAGSSLRKHPFHRCWSFTLFRWLKRASLPAGSGRFLPERHRRTPAPVARGCPSPPTPAYRRQRILTSGRRRRQHGEGNKGYKGLNRQERSRGVKGAKQCAFSLEILHSKGNKKYHFPANHPLIEGHFSIFAHFLPVCPYDREHFLPG
jgi:hypothetical protein